MPRMKKPQRMYFMLKNPIDICEYLESMRHELIEEILDRLVLPVMTRLREARNCNAVT